MVEAEQVVLLRNIVEYVIWVMVLAFVMHGKKGLIRFVDYFEAYRLRDMMVSHKESFERGQI